MFKIQKQRFPLSNKKEKELVRDEKNYTDEQIFNRILNDLNETPLSEWTKTFKGFTIYTHPTKGYQLKRVYSNIMICLPNLDIGCFLSCEANTKIVNIVNQHEIWLLTQEEEKIKKQILDFLSL